MILMIDNYCSFTYNIVQYFGELKQKIVVKRNNEMTPDEIDVLAPKAIILGPGPCTPTEAGISLDKFPFWVYAWVIKPSDKPLVAMLFKQLTSCTDDYQRCIMMM